MYLGLSGNDLVLEGRETLRVLGLGGLAGFRPSVLDKLSGCKEEEGVLLEAIRCTIVGYLREPDEQ